MLLKNAEAFLPTPISYTTDWSYDKSCFINFSETLTSVPANKVTIWQWFARIAAVHYTVMTAAVRHRLRYSRHTELSQSQQLNYLLVHCTSCRYLYQLKARAIHCRVNIFDLTTL